MAQQPSSRYDAAQSLEYGIRLGQRCCEDACRQRAYRERRPANESRRPSICIIFAVLRSPDVFQGPLSAIANIDASLLHHDERPIKRPTMKSVVSQVCVSAQLYCSLRASVFWPTRPKRNGTVVCWWVVRNHFHGPCFQTV